MPARQEMQEAIRTAFRYADVSEYLNADVYKLMESLGFISCRKNQVTCVGVCVNGGSCSRNIEVHKVARAVTEIVLLAENVGIAGDALKERLRTPIDRILCYQHKSNAANVHAAIDKACDVIENHRSIFEEVVRPDHPEDKISNQAQADEEQIQSLIDYIEKLELANEGLTASKKKLEREKASLQHILSKKVKSAVNKAHDSDNNSQPSTSETDDMTILRAHLKALTSKAAERSRKSNNPSTKKPNPNPDAPPGCRVVLNTRSPDPLPRKPHPTMPTIPKLDLA